MLKLPANANQYAYYCQTIYPPNDWEVLKLPSKSTLCSIISGLVKTACKLVEESYKLPLSPAKEAPLPLH